MRDNIRDLWSDVNEYKNGYRPVTDLARGQNTASLRFPTVLELTEVLTASEQVHACGY
jgi:hypothetical protein